MSWAPFAPSRTFGSFCKSFRSKSTTSLEMSAGMGGLLYRIRLQSKEILELKNLVSSHMGVPCGFFSLS